jgi:nitrite reductase/ring-hydroxylating ferredoxin subunit
MKLADVHDIPNPGSISHDAAGKFRPYNIMLVRNGLDIKAYVNSCPHTGAPLDFVDGRFLSPDKQHIQCTTHDALFDINNGRCLAGPCPGQSLKPVAIEVINGEVWLAD